MIIFSYYQLYFEQTHFEFDSEAMLRGFGHGTGFVVE